MRLPFAKGSFRRDAAEIPLAPFRNRYVEPNPVLDEGVGSAISRPTLRKFAEVGDGPVRGIHNSPGLFDNQLMVVSGNVLFRISTDGEATRIRQLSTFPVGDVSWAAVANIGSTPARLFIAEGNILWVYTTDGEATGRLEATGLIANSDVVRIDSVYYQFTTGSVDDGTPSGSVSDPWLVSLGGTNALSINNLYHSINGTGTPGVVYSTELVEHPAVLASESSSADLVVVAKEFGIAGNGITTSTTSSALVWSDATLQGGGQEQIRQVPLPGDEGAISIAHINSYVIVVPTQNTEYESVGKFYWIEPGETSIDPLNFATAERSPDKIHQVVVFGNAFWLMGEQTTEPWITTGNPAAPVQRYTSITYDRGSWEGTAVQVKDSLITTDEDGAVFQISGSQERISRPDVEARIRKAMSIESSSFF